MNTSFFGELLQTISERGRALLARDRRGDASARSESLVELCEDLLSGRGEASGVALRARNPRPLRRADHRPAHRLLRGAGAALRHRSGAHGAGRSPPGATAPSDATAAEVHAASEPRRQELFRRLNLAPGGTAALVRMREQLMDVLDHRDDLARGRRRFRPSVLVLVQPRLPGAAPHRLVDAGDRAGEDHPLRGGARDQRLGRSAPPHRSARPALLRVLPSGAGRRAADLRRGGAHPRHSGRDRADPRDRTAR